MSDIMDPSKMKVAELRAELQERGLDTKGNKPVLVERLREALDAEVAGEDGVDDSAGGAENEELEEIEQEEEVEPEPVVEAIEPEPEPSPMKKVQSEPEASPAKKVPEPSPVKKVPELSPVKKVPDPSPVKKMPEPSPVKKVPEHSPVKKVPEPSPVKKVPEPSPVKKVPESSPVKKVPDPSPVKKMPEPSPVKKVPELEPLPVKKVPEPSPAKKAPEPSPAKKTPEPSPAKRKDSEPQEASVKEEPEPENSSKLGYEEEPVEDIDVKTEQDNGLEMEVKEEANIKEEFDVKEEPTVSEETEAVRRGEKRALSRSRSPETAPDSKRSRPEVEEVRIEDEPERDMTVVALDWCSMESTRSKTEVWLIGQHITEITGAQLPSRGDVLRLFFHGHNEHKKTVNDSASEVAASVISFWNKARIPTITEKSIGRKVVDLFLMWKGLKKNCTRTTDTQRKKEETFCDELEDLFDVAHPKAMQLLTIKEDRAFLAAQREKGRRGVMAGVDKKIACSMKRREESKSKQSLQQNQASSALEYDELGSSSETESQSSSSSSTSSLAISPVVSSSNRKRATLKVITPELSSTLDRTGISHRSALRIVSATAASLGHDPMELVLNYETVRTSRATHRSGIANEIKEKFQPSEVLTVHWDGKIIPDEQGASVDRIAILVSGINTEKLLGVPKLLSGTGQAIATAVSAALEEWKISENVSALSFDTTASNTGHLSGACVILEQKLGRRLLHLACRHHILELVAEKAYVECMGPSSGPDITLFSRFKHKWKDISQDDYSPLSDLPPSLYEKRDDLICCWKHHLGKKQQPRDDYREVLELAIRCLDGALPKFNLRRPGALHRARWMAKLIYVMKILIFANQFKLTARETLGLKRFTFFVLEVYVSAWFTASVPSSAPANDLRLLQDLSEYHDVKISRTCLTVFGRHLWYLSEGLVGLALFDPQVNATMKTNIVRAIVERKATEDSPKRAALPATSSLPTKQLSDFASRGSNFLFESLKMKTSFLSKEPDTWSDDEDFKTGVAVVGGLRVINDTAERGIALIQAFNSKITKSEDQRQHLLQVVEEQRRSQPGTSKQDLTSKNRKQ